MTNSYNTYLQSLPIDWEKVPIEQIGDVFAGGTPSRAISDYWNGTIAWVTPGELTGLTNKWLTQTREYITASGLAHSGATLLPKGSLLVTTRATIGSVAIAGIEVCTNQGFKNVVPNQSSDSLFYYYLIYFIAPEMVRLASGSTFDEISRKDFVQITVPRPFVKEQQRIAHILDTIDEQIQETDRLLAKLKLVKAGLLHDLLTRGIDEHGDVRDPVTHPEQFKDSALGRIPREWEDVRLEEYISTITSGSRGWAAYYSNTGALFLRIGDLTREHIHLELKNVIYVKPPHGTEGARTRVEAGDILISITADLGIVGVIPPNFEEAYVNQHIALVRLNDEVNPYYVGNFLASQMGQKQFYQLNDSGAKAGLNLPTISKLLIAIPSKQEQTIIADIINSHDARIASEEEQLAKLRQVKRGLMHDLLTGRVRVGGSVRV